MEITKDVINKLYLEIEAMNITPEQGSQLTSASLLRLKLLVWLKFENEDDYEIGKKRAIKFIDELKLKFENEDEYEIGKKRARKFIDELKLKYEIETI